MERVVRRGEYDLDSEDVERVQRKSLKDLTSEEREVYDAFFKVKEKEVLTMSTSEVEETNSRGEKVVSAAHEEKRRRRMNAPDSPERFQRVGKTRRVERVERRRGYCGQREGEYKHLRDCRRCSCVDIRRFGGTGCGERAREDGCHDEEERLLAG